jgi:hypothetical protein
MKRMFNISVLILVYILFTAKSCESDEQSRAQEEAQTAAAKDSIAGVFTSDSLGNSALRAFEANAMSKVLDFGDYLNILADTAAGGVFKAKAGEMIGELFISGEVHINLSCRKGEEFNGNLNRQMEKAGFKNIDIPRGTIFDSVIVSQQLQKLNDTMYEGKLGCRIRCPNSTLAGKNVFCSNDKIIHFFLVKRDKTFGIKSLEVWSVLMGDIE